MRRHYSCSEDALTGKAPTVAEDTAGLGARVASAAPGWHLATEMEHVARPGTIVLTAATLRLVEGLVQVTALGPVPVTGLPEPLMVYELRDVSAVHGRFQAAAEQRLGRRLEERGGLVRRQVDGLPGGRGRLDRYVVGVPDLGRRHLARYELEQAGVGRRQLERPSLVRSLLVGDHLVGPLLGVEHLGNQGLELTGGAPSCTRIVQEGAPPGVTPG